MPLRGELNSVDLAHVFQMLILNQKAGTLEIVHEGVGRQLYFTPAGVMVPFERDLLERRAVAAMVRSGELTEEQVHRARSNMEVLRHDLMATLLDMRATSRETQVRALRNQLEEDVYDLFFLRDASFEFRDGEAPRGEGEISEDLALSPNGLIMEAARRVDEWEYIRELVPSTTDIFELRSDPSQLKLPDLGRDASVVAGAIDGMRTVEEIIEHTGVARFAAFRVIAGLLDQGIAVSVTPEMVVVRAKSCLEAGNISSARNLYEHAIAQGTDDLVVLVGAGQAYEKLRQPAKAAERYLAAGRKAEEQGDLAKALELYLRIRRVMPAQVGARERLFALRKVAPSYLSERFDAEKEGWELAQILCHLDRKDDLNVVFHGILELAQDDADKCEKVGDLAISMGNVALAIDALLAGVDQLHREKDFDGALRLLKRAQGLDPSRINLTNRIHAVGGSIARLRERRRSIVRSVMMVIGAVLLTAGYGKYSSAAMQAFGRYSVEDFLSSGDIDGGRDHFRSICRRYPLTIPFLLSLEKLRALDVAERNAAEVSRYRAEVERDQFESRLRQAELLKNAAVAARRSGDWSQAGELLRKARALTGDKDPLGLDEGIQEIEGYLAEARRLKSESSFYRRAGRFQEAHERLVELVDAYPNTRVARSVELPVSIDSDPPRARIRVNGEYLSVGDGGFQVTAETPFVLDLPPTDKVVIELERDGFATARVEVDPLKSPSIYVRLPQHVSGLKDLPVDLARPLVDDGSSLIAAYQRGRVGVLDANTLIPRWTRELPDLVEAAGAPLARGDEVLLPASNGRLMRLSKSNGTIVGAVTLPGAPVTDLARSGARYAVGIEHGAVAVLTGDHVTSHRLPAACSAGPVGLGDGRFAVGCEDGSAWLIGDGDPQAIPSFRSSASITSLLVERESLLLGDAAGGLSIYDWRRGESRALATGLSAPITMINADRGVAVIESREALVAVDIDRWAVAARLDGELSLALGGGALIAASRSNGEILVIERGSLDEVARYRAPDGISLRGTVVGTRGFFSAGRTVCLIFCQRH